MSLVTVTAESWFTRNQEVVDSLTAGAVVGVLAAGILGYILVLAGAEALRGSSSAGAGLTLLGMMCAGWAMFRLLRAVDGWWPHTVVIAVFALGAGVALSWVAHSVWPLVALVVAAGVARIADGISEELGSMPTSYAGALVVIVLIAAGVARIAKD